MSGNKVHGNTNPLRDQAFAEIHEHLRVHGSRNWKGIIQKYVELGVSDATMWQWIRRAKQIDASKPALVAAKARIAEALAEEPALPLTPEQAAVAAEAGRQLPVAPSPAYIAKSGEHGMRNFDMIRELEAIYSDALALRTYAIKVEQDAEGQPVEKIRNAMVFERQMLRRLNVLDTTLKAMGEVWNLRQMQDFYEVVVQEIARESPETARRIMTRLSELNDRRGMSMDMRV